MNVIAINIVELNVIGINTVESNGIGIDFFVELTRIGIDFLELNGMGIDKNELTPSFIGKQFYRVVVANKCLIM